MRRADTNLTMDERRRPGLDIKQRAVIGRRDTLTGPSAKPTASPTGRPPVTPTGRSPNSPTPRALASPSREPRPATAPPTQPSTQQLTEAYARVPSKQSGQEEDDADADEGEQLQQEVMERRRQQQPAVGRGQIAERPLIAACCAAPAGSKGPCYMAQSARGSVRAAPAVPRLTIPTPRTRKVVSARYTGVKPKYMQPSWRQLQDSSRPKSSTRAGLNTTGGSSVAANVAAGRNSRLKHRYQPTVEEISRVLADRPYVAAQIVAIRDDPTLDKASAVAWGAGARAGLPTQAHTSHIIYTYVCTPRVDVARERIDA